jgi:hypothetical protein
MSGFKDAVELAQDCLSRGESLSVLTKPVHPTTVLAIMEEFSKCRLQHK